MADQRPQQYADHGSISISIGELDKTWGIIHISTTIFASANSSLSGSSQSVMCLITVSASLHELSWADARAVHPQGLCDNDCSSNPITCILLLVIPSPPESKQQKTCYSVHGINLVVRIVQRLGTKIMRLSCGGSVTVLSRMDKLLATDGKSQEKG